MANWTIEAFSRRHDRSGFVCGRDSLDDFIRTRVSQYEKRRLGKTFVAVPAGGTQVVGYITLAAGAVAFDHLPPASARKLPKHPIPVIVLARLAVDQSVQRQGLGEMLLFDALQRALKLSGLLGVHAIQVDALDLHAVDFYRSSMDLRSLLDNPLNG